MPGRLADDDRHYTQPRRRCRRTDEDSDRPEVVTELVLEHVLTSGTSLDPQIGTMWYLTANVDSYSK